MKPFFRFLSAAALLAGSAGLMQPAQAQDKPVKVVTDATFPPYESIGPDGKLVGYDIELMEAVCAESKLNCNITSAAWEGMLSGLTSGQYDVVISQISVTPERRKIIAFSDVYNYPVIRFVGKKGTSYDFTPEGLKGKNVSVQAGTPMHAFLVKRFPGVNIKTHTAGSAAYLDLTAGRADLTITYAEQARYSFLKSPEGKDFELVGPPYTGKDAPELGEGVAIAVNKSKTALLQSINEGLAKVRESGKLAALDEKYFGTK